MDSIDMDDRTACFLGADREVGIVVHEDKGEVLRMEGEEITFDQMAMLRFVQTNEPVSLERGQLYEPQPDAISVVPNG